MPTEFTAEKSMPSDPGTEPLLDAALAYHKAGRLDQAEALYHQVLERDPDDLDALNLLGLLRQSRKDIPGSIALLSRAVQLDPDFPEALTNLARAQCAAGDAEAAAASAGHAAAQDPELAEAHLQLGRALLVLGQDDAAATAFRRAVSLAPDSVDAHTNLGLALARLEDWKAAVASYQAALRLDPESAGTLHYLAMAFVSLGQHAQAAECAHQAVALAPHDPAFCAGLAQALRDNRDIAGATEACRRALALTPERVDLWVLQGSNFGMLGRFEDAALCYRHALEIDPDMADAITGLAGIGQLRAEDPRLDRLRTVLNDSAHSIPDRVAAGFALGSTLDRARDYDSAFASYAAANHLAHQALISEGRATDVDLLSRRVNWLLDAFGEATFRQTAGWGDPSELPVFVVGMPRSGTTLVEQIAASHPLVLGLGERKDIPAIAAVLEAGTDNRLPQDWDPSIVRREAEGHIAGAHQRAGGAVRVIDKLPDNVLLLGHIATLFPRARVVICRRDLRDVGLSCFFQPFSDGMSWSFDLAGCAARACEIERLSHHWLATLPLRILEVQYEALVADPESESRRLIDFLGIEWDPRCLAFHKTDRTVMSASSWQVRQPLYSSSVGHWRHYLRHSGPLLEGVAGLVSTTGGAGERDTPAQVLAVARTHRAAGRTGAAEAACRAVLTDHPDRPDALHQLGQILCDRGDHAQAWQLLSRAAAMRPDDPELLTALGQLDRARGDPQAAADIATRAIGLAPDHAEAHLLLGLALLDLNDPVAAVDALRHAATLDPDSFNAHLNLATGCIRLANHAAATDPLIKALRLRPDHVEALSKLGFVLGKLDQHDEALECHRKAVALGPKDPRTHRGLIAAVWANRDVVGTLEACRRALELAPDQAEFWLSLAEAEAALGRFAEADVGYRRALDIDPDCHQARLRLAITGSAVNDPADLTRLHVVLDDASKPDHERTAAGFALGTALEQTGEYDAAFAAFAAANRLCLATHPPARIPFDVDALQKIFRPKAFTATAGWGDPSDIPVFIVGMPRSGTTLVEQIAASHPSVYGAGERKDIGPIIGMLESAEAIRSPDEWDPAMVREAAAHHVAKLQAIGGGAARVIDKMPDNIQFLGHIGVLFPRARIIICRRDLRDVCLSCFFQHFVDRLDWANDLGDLAARARETERLTALWQETLPLRMLEIQYEALVGDLESESRRLIDFLGLEWDPACLAFHRTERAVLTASYWQVRQPLYASSVGRWRRYRKHLGPLLEGLAGYIPNDPG